MPIKAFAGHVVDLGRIKISDEVRHATRRCLIDWFATTVPGGVRPPATFLCEALADELDRGNAALVPSGRRALGRAAALINGAASHTVEFDDIYRDAIYHPGAPVISAALALAQDRQVNGDRLLRAIIAGYEVSTRIGAAVTPAHYEYWHTTGTVGAFGAAAAACLILGLDRDEVEHALANAATMAAGLQQAFRSDAMSKPLHAGRAAETGVLVALAAARGVTGATGMLDGPRGFGNAMSRDANWDSAIADLGQHFNITRMTQKNHGCCGHSFAALDAIIALRESHRLVPEDVSRIRIGTYSKALEVTGNDKPVSGYEAKFSLPYCASVALIDGRVRLNAFDDQHLEDREIRELIKRIELYVDPQCDKGFPKQRAAVVEMHTRDGRVLRFRAPTRKGDPDSPLSDAELVDKYRELVAPVIGEASAEGLLDVLWRIDVIDDVSALLVSLSGLHAVGASN
ncbi:MAG: MmgE/PrpD family protein [Gammaproteobacteria bacterium]|nr:MmgE/PrpD family protein [Gammaproteobacteria bacterium]